MRILITTFILSAVPLWAQPGLPTVPSIDQKSRIAEGQLGGLNDALSPDIPDSGALHTPKGRLFEQPAMNGDDIAIMYYQLTGKRVISTSAMEGLEIKIIQPGPLTNGEIVDLIETKLIMEGVELKSVAGNARQLRLVQQAGGNGGKIGSRLILDENALPPNDEIVTYSMHFNYMKPEDAAQIFQTVIGQFSPGGSIVAVPNASKLLITDNAILIKNLIQLKNQIDVKNIDFGTKFVKITYADAEQIAEQINELVNNEDAASGGIANTPSIPSGVAIPGQLQGSAGADIPLKIVAENRTNRIVLSGSPSKIRIAETLIAQLDQPAATENSIRRKLKYLPVRDFMPIAANAIQATLGNAGGSSSTTSSNRSNNNQPSQNNRSTSNNTRSSSSGFSNAGGFGNSSSGSRSSSGGGRASLSGQDGDIAPDAQLIGKTLLVADNISNSIVVNGPPHHIEIVQNLLDELDQRSEQIAITAVFGNYGSVNGSSFGTDLVSLFDNTTTNPNYGGGTLTRNGAGTYNGIFTAATLADFATASLGSGLNLGFAKDELGVFLNAAKTNTSFREFSRPTIFTTNNRSARISSGSRIAVPTGSYNGGGSFGSSTQIEYRDVALELEVRPLVNGVDEVTLEIALVKDSLGQTREISTGGTNLETQDIDSRELETIVTVPNKSLIVLGGLYTDNDNDAVSKVPLLGDIPLLGRLFRNNTTNKDLSELVIMIYPRIISNTQDLYAYQGEYDNRSYIAPPARENFYENALLDDPNKVKKKGSWWNKPEWNEQDKRKSQSKPQQNDYQAQPRQTTRQQAPEYSSSTLSSFNHDRVLGTGR